MNLKNWKDVSKPAHVAMEGRYARLEPLDPTWHGPELFQSAVQPGAEERFRYLPDEPPVDQASFAAWLQKAAASRDPMFFAVIDQATGRAEGRQAFMRIKPAHGVIEIGHVFWGPAIAKTRVTTEAFYLFASHVFDTLGYRRLEWKCNNRNEPSKKAATRFGFSFEGVFRHHQVVKGESRDTAWFSIIAPEWPRISDALTTWLDPSNFDEKGQQRRKLEECKA